jgi:hypothetical protein
MKKLVGHNQINLWDLNKRYKSQRYLLPPWQRDFVWSKAKVNRWWADIQDSFNSKQDYNIPGVLLIYSIKDNPTKWINDGVNRTVCTNKFISDNLV